VLVSASALKGDAQRFSQEVSHKAEWTIRHLQVDLKTLQVKYKNMFVPAGQYITSPHFRIAGSEGYLRFWPNGYYSTATRLERMRMDLGGLRADSWCAVALSMPADTKLRLRFRIGDQWSELRTCSWEAGSVIQQVWMPPLQEPPEQLDDLVVGVEIHQNLELNPLPGLPSVAWSTPRYGQLPAVESQAHLRIQDEQILILGGVLDHLPTLGMRMIPWPSLLLAMSFTIRRVGRCLAVQRTPCRRMLLRTTALSLVLPNLGLRGIQSLVSTLTFSRLAAGCLVEGTRTVSMTMQS